MACGGAVGGASSGLSLPFSGSAQTPRAGAALSSLTR